MLSHPQLKFLRSLHISKLRAKEKQILVEGEKLVKECLNKSYSSGFELLEVFALEDWIKDNQELIRRSACLATIITPKQLKQISIQKNHNQAVGLLRYSESTLPKLLDKNELYLATDQLQDPGNMGTIFRMAEWFGVQSIILSTDSVDPYNPKVIQSSMGSVLRIPFYRTDLKQVIDSINGSIPIYGTMLNGENIYTTATTSGGLIVLGNESKGISAEISKLITKPLLIPKFSKLDDYPESLNVATAAGIVLSEFRRS